MVRDYLPLQQGLRLARITAVIAQPASPRLSSITTRIKTLANLRFLAFFAVRDYLPLQQGLRLTFRVLIGERSLRPRLSSITTRIKTQSHNHNCV